MCGLSRQAVSWQWSLKTGFTVYMFLVVGCGGGGGLYNRIESFTTGFVHHVHDQHSDPSL